MKNLYLISNDKIWKSQHYYTSNNDLNNIISCFVENYKIFLINRKSNKKLNFFIKDKFTLLNIKDIKEKKINLMLISITPYNFLVLLKLIFLKKINIKGYVYLRSDGFLEYKHRYGILGYYFYYFMFKIISSKLKILSCSNNFTKVKVRKILHPSELDSVWFRKNASRNKYLTDFLYVGRFKKDKGGAYLSQIFKEYLKDYKLTIVGNDKESINRKYYNKNIKFLGPISNTKKLIKIYDSTRIFILASYIEGFPKVISESLARLRPVIIFEDIKYVIHGRKGIFVCKRNEKSLRKTINYVLKNYSKIQIQIKKNFFFYKEKFYGRIGEFN